MIETAAARSRCLYGRLRIPRSHRRVMLALLAADRLSAYPLSRFAQAVASAGWVALWRMEDRGWSVRRRHESCGSPVRFTYKLMAEGRVAGTLLLRLEAGDA